MLKVESVVCDTILLVRKCLTMRIRGENLSDYFYVLILISIFVYQIVREIYLFNKGKYNPYMFKRGEFEEPYFVRLGLSLAMLFCLNNIKIKLVPIYFLSTYAFGLGTCTNILNYLSYRKSKDKKIIIHTIIFDIILIIMAMFLWRLKQKSM